MNNVSRLLKFDFEGRVFAFREIKDETLVVLDYFLCLERAFRLVEFVWLSSFLLFLIVRSESGFFGLRELGGLWKYLKIRELGYVFEERRIGDEGWRFIEVRRCFMLLLVETELGTFINGILLGYLNMISIGLKFSYILASF